MSSARVHIGRVEASGFLLDHGLIGLDEAQRRVVHHWQAGSSLFSWDATRWLLLVPRPVPVRTQTAPGTPLCRQGSQLVGADGIPTPATKSDPISILDRGRVVTKGRSELQRIDPVAWIQTNAIVVHQLESLASPTAPVAVATPAPAPDLRSRANVNPAPSEAGEFVAAAQRAAATRARRAAGGQAQQRRPLENAVAKLALRTPLAEVVGRRHAQYLDDLTRRFTRGELDEALRRAIPIDGLGAAGLSLRLPGRRENLQITWRARSSGGSVPLGPTINEHLRELYRDAAQRLEQSGRIEEAVFAHADLLNDAGAAVGVLERARRWQEAASLAEGRQLDAARVMRLWFRAGDRYRGVLAARRAGAFPQAIARMGEDDPDLIREIRRDWGASCIASGDRLGAVEAMWPDASLRPLLDTAIDEAIIHGGPVGARLSAFRATWRPTAEHRGQVSELLDPASEWSWEDRRLFVLELAGLEAGDPVVDRELCSAATRSMISMPRKASSPSDRMVETALRRIRRRSDPVLSADVPSRTVAADVGSGGLVGPVRHSAGRWGDTAVHDAAYLPNGDLLVALGQSGVAVLRPDGTPRFALDVPADALVMADHGGRALLLEGQGTMVSVHALDISSRRVRHWSTLRIRRAVDSFDGALWTVIDERGLCVYDTTADHPVITWRELEPKWAVVDLQRTANGLGAIIAMPPTHLQPTVRIERWGWSMPSMRLHTRQACEVNEGFTAVLASGAVAQIFGDGHRAVLRLGNASAAYPLDEQPRVVQSAAFPCVSARPGGLLRLDMWPDMSKEAAALYLDEATTVRVRCQPDTITVIDDRGRIIVLDEDASRVIAEVAVRLGG